jgi:hypothetical protein
MNLLLSSDCVNSGRCYVTPATCTQQLKNGVFYVVRAATIAMQRRGEQASITIEELCFLRGPCRGGILTAIGATVQLHDHGSRKNSIVKTRYQETSSIQIVEK